MYYAFFVFSYVLNRAKIPIFLAFHVFLPEKKCQKPHFFRFWPCGSLCLWDKSACTMTVGHAVVAMIRLVVQAGGQMRHADDNSDRRGDGNKHHQTTGSAHVTQKTRKMGKEAEN